MCEIYSGLIKIVEINVINLINDKWYIFYREIIREYVKLLTQRSISPETSY